MLYGYWIGKTALCFLVKFDYFRLQLNIFQPFLSHLNCKFCKRVQEEDESNECHIYSDKARLMEKDYYQK